LAKAREKNYMKLSDGKLLEIQIMSEKDGQLALEYILEILKEQRANLGNIRGFRNSAFGGKYKEIDEYAIKEAWYNLFIDGWIMPSSDSVWLNNDWFTVTSYGKSQLGKIGEDYYPVFLDPGSTISELKSAIPNIDPIAVKYFEEALWAIQKRLFLSATITMGGASESSILSLIDAVIDYYEDATLTASFAKTDKIKPKFDLLLGAIKSRNLKKELQSIFATDRVKCENIKEIFINVETVLQRMFDIYRINRNDAGHPTDIGSDPDLTRSEAAMFRKFCRIVYGLISYMDEAKVIKKALPPT
jgi:hypothetical protein